VDRSDSRIAAAARAAEGRTVRFLRAVRSTGVQDAGSPRVTWPGLNGARPGQDMRLHMASARSEPAGSGRRPWLWRRAASRPNGRRARRRSGVAAGGGGRRDPDPAVQDGDQSQLLGRRAVRDVHLADVLVTTSSLATWRAAGCRQRIPASSGPSSGSPTPALRVWLVSPREVEGSMGSTLPAGGPGGGQGPRTQEHAPPADQSLGRGRVGETPAAATGVSSRMLVSRRSAGSGRRVSAGQGLSTVGWLVDGNPPHLIVLHVAAPTPYRLLAS
jgi:hypothetical protein